MADIFISYAKADRELVVRLAAFLEANGYTTWWDTSLLTGDDFRKVIMQELGKARAAIVIWTPNSINSDWVRSEAGRAQADRKLIPVKLTSLTYKDIPPPFDVIHTENITAEENILAGVVALLAKPGVQPSTLAVISKTARYQFLTYFGIIGGAVTLFTNVRSLIDLADWAQRLITQWHQITNAFWSAMFAWIGFKVPAEWYPLLSFTVFCLSLACAARIRANPSELATTHMTFFGRHIPLYFLPPLIAGAMVLYFGFFARFSSVANYLFPTTFDQTSISDRIDDVFIGTIGILVLIVIRDEFPNERRGLWLMTFLLLVFSCLLLFIPAASHVARLAYEAGYEAGKRLEPVPTAAFDSDTLEYVIKYSVAFVPFLIATVRCVAPLRSVNRRLFAIAGTFLLLIGVNYAYLIGRDVMARLSANG